MEGFFEANRLVEVSMVKLGSLHKGGELPLRKTLMISKVLNNAQNLATSAHYSLLHTSPQTPTRRSSSKLLASISKKVEHPSSSCFEDDPLPPVQAPARTAPKPQRELSPIVSCSVSRQEPGEEAMDFESVNSVISTVLSDCEMSSTYETKVSHDEKDTNLNWQGDTSLLPKNVLSESGKDWNAWRFDPTTEANKNSSWCWPQDPRTPGSPYGATGKRHHNEAFPADKENVLFTDRYDESKRFKPSPPEGCPLESLPGFCGYLSPKNLQSAPLITYMFGKGFAEPSNPTSSDWPSTFSPAIGSEQNGLMEKEEGSFSGDHFASHFQTSTMKLSPILAF